MLFFSVFLPFPFQPSVMLIHSSSLLSSFSKMQKAFESLSGSTHLYGRRLVLEWAAGSSQEENEERKRRDGEINPGSYGSSFPGDEHIPRRQKSSVTGSVFSLFHYVSASSLAFDTSRCE